MAEEKKEGTLGQLLVLAAILGIALPLCNTVAVLLGLAGENPMMTLWPGYLPLLLFMIGQERTFRDFLNIVASGLVGIVTAVVSLLLIHVCSGSMPELAAMFIGTFACIFVFSIWRSCAALRPFTASPPSRLLRPVRTGRSRAQPCHSRR